jgi:hypothetical protein
MNGLNAQFMLNVPAFMAVNVIQIGSNALLNKPKSTRADTAGRPDAGVCEFDLRQTNKGYVELDLLDNRGKAKSLATNPIRAYWLPWEGDATAELTLGPDAHFFFTSNLDGCRVQIKGRTNPVVYHISGGCSTGLGKGAGKEQLWRDEQSKARKGNLQRTFSTSAHYGNMGFVAGYRNLTDYKWYFVGQAIDYSNGAYRIGRIHKSEQGIMSF